MLQVNNGGHVDIIGIFLYALKRPATVFKVGHVGKSRLLLKKNGDPSIEKNELSTLLYFKTRDLR